VYYYFSSSISGSEGIIEKTKIDRVKFIFSTKSIYNSGTVQDNTASLTKNGTKAYVEYNRKASNEYYTNLYQNIQSKH
ncbi:hypothetical protein, partial [Pseudomonas silesiensis]|uniref:hypothetical protein n=1 Tax=Pseudomonas silesiensis TaxID=1853130 RepID=UPI0034D5B3AB